VLLLQWVYTWSQLAPKSTPLVIFTQTRSTTYSQTSLILAVIPVSRPIFWESTSSLSEERPFCWKGTSLLSDESCATGNCRPTCEEALKHIALNLVAEMTSEVPGAERLCCLFLSPLNKSQSSDAIAQLVTFDLTRREHVG